MCCSVSAKIAPRLSRSFLLAVSRRLPNRQCRVDFSFQQNTQLLQARTLYVTPTRDFVLDRDNCLGL